MKNCTSFLVLFSVTVLALSACDRRPSDTTKGEVIGMPNPAAEHCTKEGGKPEIRELDNGDQQSICMMPDGKKCDAWIMKRENRCEEVQE